MEIPNDSNTSVCIAVLYYLPLLFGLGVRCEAYVLFKVYGVNGPSCAADI